MLTLAYVRDDATGHFRAESLPLVGMNGAVDALVLIIGVLQADAQGVGDRLPLEDAVGAEVRIEVEEVAEAVVLERSLADGRELPASPFPLEDEVAYRAIVQVDTLHPHHRILLLLLVVLGPHLSGIAVERGIKK